MNLNDLTIGEAKQLARLFSGAESSSLNKMIGQSVIVRTYSAGVHFGLLSEKSGNEVILKNARRLWQWKAKAGISLSAVAVNGLDESSAICEPLDSIWLEAIEIIPVYPDVAEAIKGAPSAKAR